MHQQSKGRQRLWSDVFTGQTVVTNVIFDYLDDGRRGDRSERREKSPESQRKVASTVQRPSATGGLARSRDEPLSLLSVNASQPTAHRSSLRSDVDSYSRYDGVMYTVIDRGVCRIAGAQAAS